MSAAHTIPPDSPIARRREAARLEELARHHLLDTPPDPDFDAITRLVARLCDVPFALVSLLDEDRQWFKSAVGIQAKQTPRDIAFCEHAIHRGDVLEVPDATADPRFQSNPLVTGPPHIRFYAGRPLRARESGHALGTLCVLDRRPRRLTEAQREALDALGLHVENAILLRRLLHESEAQRRALQELSSQREELTQFLVHDLRSPLMAVSMCADALSHPPVDPRELAEIATDLSRASRRMLRMTEDVLDVARSDAVGLQPRLVALDVAALTRELVADKRRLHPDQPLFADASAPARALADAELLRRLLDNLVSNAIRYAAGTPIAVRASRRGEAVRLEVADGGPGVDEATRQRMFDRFARGSRRGFGLGLAFCRAVVEAHCGTIRAEANAARGLRVVVELPCAPHARLRAL